MDNKKWYMITTISGKEEKVIESLKNRVNSESLQNIIADFKVMMIPYLTYKELEKKNKGDNFRVRHRNLFPGYMFIKMEMTNDAWFIVRNTQYVTGLVGSSGQRAKPTPISNLRIKKMEKQVSDAIANFESGKYYSGFNQGDLVEVIDGPTKGQIGPILEVDELNRTATVELIMFERKTPTKIEHKNLQLK